MTVGEKKTKVITPTNHNRSNSTMNQSEFLTCNLLSEHEKSGTQSVIGFGFGFGFVSHWLKNLLEIFKPITNPSICNYIITFDSRLIPALPLHNTDPYFIPFLHSCIIKKPSNKPVNQTLHFRVWYESLLINGIFLQH